MESGAGAFRLPVRLFGCSRLHDQAAHRMGRFLVTVAFQPVSGLSNVVRINRLGSDHLCEESAKHTLRQRRVHFACISALKRGGHYVRDAMKSVSFCAVLHQSA